MLRKFSIQWWRFWMAGEGLSIKTGRALLLCAVTGIAAGFAAAGFYWLLETSRHLLTESLARFSPVQAAGEGTLYPAAPHAEPLR